MLRKAIIYNVIINQKDFEEEKIQEINAAFKIKSQGRKDFKKDWWVYLILNNEIIQEKKVKTCFT